MIAAAYPKSLLKNPGKFEEFKRAYEVSSLLSTILALIAITVFCELGSWILVDRAARDGLFGVLFPWSLVILSAVLMLGTRRALQASGPISIPKLLWFQSTVQIWWIGAVVWYSSTPLAFVMFFVMSAAAINDARYLYDTVAARLSHLLPWLSFPLLLLTVDALGGPGLLARYAEDPAYVKYALGVLASAVLLIQFVISVVGTQCYETDSAVWERGKLEAQLAEEQREREVLRRSCDLMVHGVTAGSFSHDVASPLSLVSMAADEIAEALEACEANGTELRTRLTPALDRLRRATSRLNEMTSALARSLRRAEHPEMLPVRHLVEEALEAAKLSLERYGLTASPPPEIDLAGSGVFVVSGHTGALANIFVNAVLQQPSLPMQVSGRVSNEWYYVLSVRDFGVDPESRDQALEAVRTSLALAVDPSVPPETRADRYGVALVLAKLLIVRHGGWLDVTAPASGPGLVFVLTLPRVQPAVIPVSVQSPAELANSAA